jgi:hypothetical protein
LSCDQQDILLARMTEEIGNYFAAETEVFVAAKSSMKIVSMKIVHNEYIVDIKH